MVIPPIYRKIMIAQPVILKICPVIVKVKGDVHIDSGIAAEIREHFFRLSAE